jgi:hypothetical protein
LWGWILYFLQTHSQNFTDEGCSYVKYQQDRQCTPNVIHIKACLCNHCCSGKSIIIKQPACVFVTLVIQHAMRMLHDICGPSSFYNIFQHYPINGAILGKKNIERKICVSILHKTSVWNIFHPKKNWARYCSSCKIHVIFVTFECNLNFLHRISKKSDIKLHENPSSGSGIVPCGQTDRHDEANSRFSQFCERA